MDTLLILHYAVTTLELTYGEVWELVCGEALGADTLGKLYGRLRRWKHRSFPADWDRWGKAAGPRRNETMAEYADALILLWDGKSRGSASMLKQAKKHKLIIDSDLDIRHYIA